MDNLKRKIEEARSNAKSTSGGRFRVLAKRWSLRDQIGRVTTYYKDHIVDSHIDLVARYGDKNFQRVSSDEKLTTFEMPKAEARHVNRVVSPSGGREGEEIQPDRTMWSPKSE